VIAGSTVHDGNAALAAHLLNAAENEQVVIKVHALLAQEANGALEELWRLASGTRTAKPLVHAWASPSREYDEQEWEEYWLLYEREFGLEAQPYLEAQHRKLGKGGRTAGHRHRIYLRITPEGLATPMRHTAPRNEKVSRLAEYLIGEPFNRGIYTKAVAAHLRREGYDHVADALASHGYLLARTNTSITAAERSELSERGGPAADAIAELVYRALNGSAQGQELADILLAVGLQPVMGDKAAGVVSTNGRFQPLHRLYNRVAKARGTPTVKVRMLLDRINGATLPKHGDSTAASNSYITGVVGQDRRARRNEYEREDGHILDSAPSEAPPAIGAATGPEPLDLSNITAAQRQAIEEWREAVFADRDPPRAEPSVTNTNAVIEMGKSELGIRQFASFSYKALLAGLPASTGAAIRGVDKCQEQVSVHLYSGALVVLQPWRATCIGNDSDDALDIMVQHARSQGWAFATVTGDTRSREYLARKLVRAGISPLGDEHVINCAANELERETTRNDRVAWLRARTAVLEAKKLPGHPQVMERIYELDQAVQQLAARSALPDLAQAERELLSSDLLLCQRMVGALRRGEGDKWGPQTTTGSRYGPH
jgi:hypothetical protein